jgi:FlaA1/EpsC-like NDP-sugar epimerase
MNIRIAFKNPNTYMVMAADAALLLLSYYLAYWLRFETIAPTAEVHAFFRETAPAVVAVKLAVLTVYGLESGMWRYTGLVDLMNLIKASAVSFVILMVVAFFFYYGAAAGTVSRSVFIIDMINTIILIGMFRLSVRLYYSGGLELNNLVSALAPSSVARRRGGIPALIHGANERGELLLRSLTGNEGGGAYNIVGFVDDNADFGGAHIHGRPILGVVGNLPNIAARFHVRELLVASRLSGGELESINSVCREAGVKVRIVPSYHDGRHGKIDLSHLRSIQIEDLLNRDPVVIDYTQVERMISGKRVLITGAGGSIGSQLAVQVAEFKPASLVLVDICENYLYQLGVTLEAERPAVNTKLVCLDVTDEERMDRLFREEKPHFVFHAAAHKHVPLMELNKGEAVRNNVGAIKTLAHIADRHGVERFVLISTDKAVNPANIMGATKRICELYVGEMAQKSRSSFMTVRFGNVLGSNGSVAPLFIRQIEAMGPVTVTHPDMERYFMTIPESVLLILQAASFSGQGDLYLLDMGEPVKITDLAKKMIRLAGYEPDKEIRIEYIGLRPGEKLYEELTGGWETLSPTPHPKIKRITANAPDMDVEELVEYALKNCFADPEGVNNELIRVLTGAKNPVKSAL